MQVGQYGRLAERITNQSDQLANQCLRAYEILNTADYCDSRLESLRQLDELLVERSLCELFVEFSLQTINGNVRLLTDFSSPAEFLAMVAAGETFVDYGAGLRHGPWTHTLQLWVIDAVGGNSLQTPAIYRGFGQCLSDEETTIWDDVFDLPHGHDRWSPPHAFGSPEQLADWLRTSTDFPNIAKAIGFIDWCFERQFPNLARRGRDPDWPRILVS